MRADTQNHVSPTGTQRRTKRDYWEVERENLVSALVERIASNGESVALRDLLAMELPEILKVVLRNHAKSVVRKEKPLTVQTHRRFELEDVEIRQQFRLLRDLLADRIVFDLAELKPVLNFGVRLQFDLIVRPRAFLENLFYQHSTERERDDLLVILTGFHEARDYVTLLIDKLSGYSAGVLTKEAFSALCRQCEREVYGKNPIAALMADIRAYQSYCQTLLGNAAPSEVLDNQMVLAMLNERHMTELFESLLPEFTKKESWLLEEIEALLQQHASSAGFEPRGASAAELPLSSEIDMNNFLEEAASEIEKQLVQTSLRELRAVQSAERQAGSMQTEGVVEQIAALPQPSPVHLTAESKIDIAQIAPPALPSEAAKKRPLIRFDEEEPMMITRAKLEQQPAGPFPALTKLIDEKSRKLFVRNVFQRDEDAYLDFIQRLELLQTWKEAKAQLDRELNKRKINPYSKEAIRLSDLIFGRYFAKR